MGKVSQETKKALQGARSEIIAGSVLIPRSDADRAWNDANARAGRILDSYMKGEGIFQMATKKKAQP